MLSCLSDADVNGSVSGSEDTVLFGVAINKDLLGHISRSVGAPAQQAMVGVWHQDPENHGVFGRSDSLVDGISFPKVTDAIGRDLVGRFRKAVDAGGNCIFLTRMDFDGAWNSMFDLTIIPASDQFQVVERIGTEAGSYDLTNAAIVAKLRDLHIKHPFSLVVIDEDRVEGYFERPPVDPLGLAREIIAFCPDVIEQGYGDTTEMVTDLRDHRFFWLWWD